jgi:hypothetical protein
MATNPFKSHMAQNHHSNTITFTYNTLTTGTTTHLDTDHHHIFRSNTLLFMGSKTKNTQQIPYRRPCSPRSALGPHPLTS